MVKQLLGAKLQDTAGLEDGGGVDVRWRALWVSSCRRSLALSSALYSRCVPISLIVRQHGASRPFGRGLREIGPVASAPMAWGGASGLVGAPVGVLVFFGHVNRVLVRPWTRGTTRVASAVGVLRARARPGAWPGVCPPSRAVFRLTG